MTQDDKRRGLPRRRFLELTAGASIGVPAWLAQGCSRYEAADVPPRQRGGANVDTSAGPIFTPRINDGIGVAPVWRLNADPHERTVHPDISPELVALQLRTVYELGFDGIRITASYGLGPSLVAAIPYVRAARAIGLDAVVVLSDFGGLEIATALFDEKQRARVLAFYAKVFGTPPLPVVPNPRGLGPGGAGRVAFEILNEPALFFGIPPATYVHDFLAPCFGVLRELDHRIIVVSAAEVGTSDGPPRMRAMLEAGLETVCDRIAYHIYDPDVIRMLPSHVRGTVWITETGAQGVGAHLPWVRDRYAEIHAQLQDVTRLFYFDLYDNDSNLFRLIDIKKTPTGYERIVESTDLVAYFTQRVADDVAGRAVLPFDTLIPDIRLYFPTEEDIAAYVALFES